MNFDIVVICTHCGKVVPYTPPDLNHPWGVWDWHRPCQNCGAEDFAAHDINCDWKTGRALAHDDNRFGGKPN